MNKNGWWCAIDAMGGSTSQVSKWKEQNSGASVALLQMQEVNILHCYLTLQYILFTQLHSKSFRHLGYQILRSELYSNIIFFKLVVLCCSMNIYILNGL